MLFTMKQKKYTSERGVRILRRFCRLSPQTSLCNTPVVSLAEGTRRAQLPQRCPVTCPGQPGSQRDYRDTNPAYSSALREQSSDQSRRVTLVQALTLLLALSWNLLASYTNHVDVSLLLSQRSDLLCKFLSLFQFLLIWLVNTRDTCL